MENNETALTLENHLASEEKSIENFITIGWLKNGILPMC